MSLQDFLSKLVLPIGIFLQIVGYAESVHNFVGLPEPFLIASCGFLLTIACLVWLAWFSGKRLAATTRRLALGLLAVVSVSYYLLVNYEVISEVERNIIKTDIEIESARSLVTSDAAAAIERANKIIAKMPDVAELYNIRGVAFNNEQNFQEALNNFQKAAKLDPTDRQYELNVAEATRSLCDYREAKQLLDKYVSKYTADMNGHYNHGVVNQILNDQDSALAEYNVVIQSNAEPTESALFNSAVVYAARTPKAADQHGSLAKAIGFLNRAIRISPTTRVQKIKAALVPLDERAQKCDGYYATDDLTPVAGLPEFVEWLRHFTI